MAIQLGLSDVAVLARVHATALPGADVPAARTALAEGESRLDVSRRVEARWLLWRASRDPADLAEAKSLADRLVAGAPPEFRERMLRRVRLLREVAAATADRGPAAAARV